MKWLLILILLLSGCSIKEEPIEVEEEPEEVIEVDEPGEYKDMVFLRENIEFPEYDLIRQDYYSNALALYKENNLVAFFDPHGDNLLKSESACYLFMEEFFITRIDPTNPAQLSLSCDGVRELYGYSSDMKSLYPLGQGEPRYALNRVNAMRILYILESSTIVKEVDIFSYLNRKPNDPLVIKDYERQKINGVIPVYELKQEPSLVNDVMQFDLTGKVGYVTQDSLRPDILGTLRFDGVGADTSSTNGLVTIIMNGKLGLADKAGNIIVEPKYEPVRDITNEIFSENFRVQQVGAKVSVLPFNRYILDYDIDTYFISNSSQTHNYRVVKKNGKVGFIDQEANELDTFYFDDAYISLHNRAWVKQNNRWSLIEIGKDIGLKEKELLRKFEAEPQLISELTTKYQNGDICETNQTLYEVTASNGLYVRGGADPSSSTLGALNYQQKVCGVEVGEWIEFDYLDQKGYLFKEYTQVVERENNE